MSDLLSERSALADDSLRALLRLALLPGIGPRTLAELLARFDSAAAALEAPADQLAQVPRIGPKLVHAIRHADDHVDADGVIRWCEQQEVAILLRDRPGYPQPLLELSDAPPVLFARGQWRASDALAVAIVGTRHATEYGRSQAELLARQLARAGVTVVSGLARGIDAAAHRGALEGEGRTIAVLGGGLASIYPPENTALAQAVATDGAVLSEFAPHSQPRAGMFPQRNRLISGLALGVLVVEAGDRSGALITARLATEQGRDVFALPGPVTSRMSRGPHALLRDGAKLVRSVDDILEELGPLAAAVPTAEGRPMRHVGELQLNDQERAVLDVIDPAGSAIEAVVQRSGLPIQRVLATISALEVRRLIRRLSGQMIARL